MIPKVIHYMWFGRGPLPEKMRRCIDSWSRFLPDYEFMLWDENNFDVNINPFVSEAYSLKKYAFVTDYARFWVLNKFGGWYLDTDIEVLKSFNDVPESPMVLGTDELGHITALMASEPGHPLWQRMLSLYDGLKFILPDGSLNQTVINLRIEEDLARQGYVIADRRQSLPEGIEIYPSDWFHIADFLTGKLNLSPDSHAIHWHTTSWLPASVQRKRWLRINVFQRLLGKRLTTTLYSLLNNTKTSLRNLKR